MYFIQRIYRVDSHVSTDTRSGPVNASEFIGSCYLNDAFTGYISRIPSALRNEGGTLHAGTDEHHGGEPVARDGNPFSGSGSREIHGQGLPPHLAGTG